MKFDLNRLSGVDYTERRAFTGNDGVHYLDFEELLERSKPIFSKQAAKFFIPAWQRAEAFQECALFCAYFYTLPQTWRCSFAILKRCYYFKILKIVFGRKRKEISLDAPLSGDDPDFTIGDAIPCCDEYFKPSINDAELTGGEREILRRILCYEKYGRYSPDFLTLCGKLRDFFSLSGIDKECGVDFGEFYGRVKKAFDKWAAPKAAANRAYMREYVRAGRQKTEARRAYMREYRRTRLRELKAANPALYRERQRATDARKYQKRVAAKAGAVREVLSYDPM
ncbi:MAG: hypothetical protein LBL66_10905 [Clostridiales bacterium]|jgi:hypothetical protein|nr:hypothetical protein [Clostridiales bacterium]